MGRVFWGLLTLLISTCAACAAEVTPLPLAGENAPAVVLWTAEQSLPDGPLADARLDSSVRFWRAGLTMEEVAAGIREQAGVEVRFWPPEDVNRRVRVNLYLNPRTPPALRDMLVQLGWVLGCNFACTETEPRVYYLLPNAAGKGVMEAMAREREELAETRRQSVAEGTAKAWARLEGYRELLSLPREQIIARYAEADRRVALDLLDPHRRAAIRFLFSFPQAELDALHTTRWRRLTESELTAGQHVLVLEALGVESLPEDCTVAIFANSNGLSVHATTPDPTAEEGEVAEVGHGVGQVAAPADSRGYFLPPDEVDLRRALGERISDEEAEKLVQGLWERWREERMRQRLRPAVRAQWLAEPGLSSAMREALATASLMLEPDKEYALWQVQEATAVLTGRHIVSDCFYQPREGRYGWELELLDPAFRAEEQARQQRRDEWLARRGPEFSLDEAPEETQREYEALSRPSPRPFALLYWLLLLCQHSMRRPLYEAVHAPVGTEWGDAGGFLRFRTIYPDLMRGAFLPEEALAQLQAVESPSLEKVDFAAPPPTISLELAPQALAKLFGPLTAPQFVLGPKLVYEDPSTALGSARGQVRSYGSGVMGEMGAILPVLASLTEKQWEKLGTSGLNAGHDLTPTQQALLEAQGLLSGRPASAVRLVASPPAPEDTDTPATAITRVEVRAEGSEGEADMGWTFGRYGVPLHKPLPHLVSLPQ